MGDFFNSTQFDGATNGNQQNQSKNFEEQNLAHVSTSQISKWTRREDGLVGFRQKIHTVVCIGVVVSVEELTTKNIYVIDDYTIGSPLEVQLWKNENDGSGKFVLPPPIMERTYIRVIGQARFDDKKPFIVAFRVEPIVDPNEIYCHFLQVIHDSLFLEKRLNVNLNRRPDGAMDTSASLFDQDNSRMANGFNEIQRSVLNILNKHGRDTQYGLKRYEIKSYLPSVNSSIVDEAISFLVNEGHIFSTTDEDTFKSTDY